MSEGSILTPDTAKRYEVSAPPFFFNSNSTNSTYTFAVRIKTNLGYRSHLSELTSVSRSMVSVGKVEKVKTTNLSVILIPVCLLIVVLLLALSVLYIRHKKLQNSFTRFTNTHYNPRSEAATFEDNGLEEEDTSPQIRGFSDDEPLVIA